MNTILFPLLTLLAVSVFFQPKRYRVGYNPLISFLVIWLLISFLSSLRLFNLFDVSTTAARMILYGLISFSVAYYICLIAFDFLSSRMQQNTNSRRTIVYFNESIICFFAIICLAYYILSSFRSITSLLHGGSFEMIREMAQSNGKISNQFIIFLYNFFILPFSYAFEIIAVLDYWMKRRIGKLFLLNLLIMLFRMVSDGGRTTLFDFIIYMMIAGHFFMGKQVREIFNKQRAKLLALLFLGVGVLALITLSRSSYSVFRQLYFYFSMSPVMFNYWTEYVDSIGFTGNGIVSLNGFIFPVLFVLKNLVNTTYPSFFQNGYDLIALTDSQWINIARGKTNANAYVSAFWFFYADGKLIGIIIGMFLYGIVTALTFMLLQKTRSIRVLAIYLLIMQGLVFSFIRFPFAKSYYVLAFIFILLLVKQKKTRRTISRIN